MANRIPSMPSARPAPGHGRTAALLAERARVMVLASIVSVSVYTVVDLLPGSTAPWVVHPVHAIQLALLAMAWLLILPTSSRRWTTWLLLASTVLQVALLAGLGCAVGDPYTTPMLLAVLALLAASLLPWSWREQALVAGVGAVAALATVRFVTGTFDLAWSYPGIALGVSFVFSVMMVLALDRSRRQMEAGRVALERSEARYRALVADVDAVVWEIELPSFNLKFASRDLSDSLGYPARTAGEHRGAFLARVHPDDRARLQQVAEGIDGLQGYDHEYRMVAADGHLVWIHERARVIRDENGTPVRLSGLSVDTSALHRDQDALAQRSLHLEAINAAMTARLENCSWAESIQPLLRGAVRATASEFGFAARIDDDGRAVLSAFDGIDADGADGRALLAAAMDRLVGEGLLSIDAAKEARIDAAAPEGEGAAIPVGGELRTFLAMPVVVDGATVAWIGLGNRAVAYADEQRAEAAAMLRTAAVIHAAHARVEREAELEERRAQLVEILDASPYLVSTTDARGRTRYTNPAGRLLLGLDRNADVTSMAFDDFLDADEAEHLVKTVVPAAVRDGSWSGEITIRRRDGQRVPLSFVFLAHRDESGRIRFFSSTARDLTHDRQVAEEIRALNEELGRRVDERSTQLEEAMREMEAFSYSVSHDLRAPLRRIDGFCAMLEEELGASLEEQHRTWIRRVRTGAQQMGTLIDAQLKLSRVSRATLRRERVDLSRLVGDLLLEAKQADPSRTVEWTIEPGLEADADRELVSIALDNLLSNAWKYTRRRDDARIEFGLVPGRADGDAPAWFVRDNGAGFDMAYAKKLFGSFQRLHSDVEFEGTGVGLATVERIVRRHGGSVWADASPNRGATFAFTLEPGAQAPEPADSVGSTA